MSEGMDLGVSPALELLASAVEMTRKAAEMLSPEQVWTCSSGDVQAVLTVQAELEAVAAAVGYAAVREADVRGLAGEDGQLSTATWLGKKLTLHPGEAKARVKAADMLSRKAGATHAALVEGRVNAEQARAVVRGLAKIEPRASAEEFTGAEEFLLREGIGLHAGHITRLARHIEAVLDPDGDPERTAKAHRSRSLTITNLGCGQHRISGTLTDESAALLNAALGPLAAPRPAVKGPNGEPGEKDPRTAPQRLHDALADVCRQFLRFGDPPKGHGVAPHLHITASIETLKGDPAHRFARTATGEDLDIETLRRIACDAGITPIVASSLGEPLAVGRESRTATPAQWKALVARDIGCIEEGCTRPAAWCQAHHFPEWENDGQTDVDKMALLCSHGHYLVHHEGWEVRLRADGHPEMIPPKWVDPAQRPRHNAHWKLLRDGLKTDPAPGAEPDPGDEPDRGP